MTDASPATLTRRHWIGALVVLGALAFSAWLRTPGFTQGGFASHDVAGILYNAMVLHDGGLPYVDTREFKAPGSFYLATVFAGDDGTDIASFQIWANLAALLAALSVAVAGWRNFGPLAGAVAVGVYVLHDAHLDSMDANYVTWANLAQVLAGAWGLEAASRRTGGRAKLLAWLVCGALCGVAALLKRPNGVILIVAAVWAAGSTNVLKERLWAVGSLHLGFALAHLPIALHYLAAGEFSALLDGYVFSQWGGRYLAARDAGVLDSLQEGSLAFANFVGALGLLAAFSAGAIRSATAEQRSGAWQLLVWVGGTLVAASLGARFYKGYWLATAAPLALLAAAPWGVFGRSAGPMVGKVARVGVALVFAAMVARQGFLLSDLRKDRARAHDEGGRRIAEHVLANSQAEDQVWVWGWHLWDVYPFTGQRSGARIYKSLGLITTPNDDTWRRPAKPLRFVDGPMADELLEDLRANKPRWIVLGSTVPRKEFEELRAFLRAEYRRDRRVRLGRVQFWERRHRPRPPRN